MRMKYFSKFNIVTFLLHSIHEYQFFLTMIDRARQSLMKNSMILINI